MSALGVNSDFVLYSESGKIKKIPELSTLQISQEKEGKICIILFSGYLIWKCFPRHFSSMTFLRYLEPFLIFRIRIKFSSQFPHWSLMMRTLWYPLRRPGPVSKYENWVPSQSSQSNQGSFLHLRHPRLGIFADFISDLQRQGTLPELGAESNDKWSRELNFINVRNYDQRSLNRYWHSLSATFTVRQSKPKNCQFMKNWRYHQMNRSWSKLGMKLSFTSCPKIPMTKKVLELRPHLSCFPTHESIVYLRKGFIKYLLKYVKQFLLAGFYQGLRGVLSPWLLSTINNHEILLEVI